MILSKRMELINMDTAALILTIIGAVNWGLIGLFGFNAVAWLLGGATSFLSRTVFTLVGVAALCAIPSLFELGVSRDT